MRHQITCDSFENEVFPKIFNHMGKQWRVCELERDFWEGEITPFWSHQEIQFFFPCRCWCDQRPQKEDEQLINKKGDPMPNIEICLRFPVFVL